MRNACIASPRFHCKECFGQFPGSPWPRPPPPLRRAWWSWAFAPACALKLMSFDTSRGEKGDRNCTDDDRVLVILVSIADLWWTKQTACAEGFFLKLWKLLILWKQSGETSNLRNPNRCKKRWLTYWWYFLFLLLGTFKLQVENVNK